MINSSQFIKQARTWIGTPWKHQGRQKKTATTRGGADCLGILVKSAEELGLNTKEKDKDGRYKSFSAFDTVSYGRIPPQEKLLATFRTIFDEKPVASMKIGDVVLMEVDGNVQHVALITDYDKNHFGILHSNAGLRKCVEHRLTEKEKKNIKYCFRLKGL